MRGRKPKATATKELNGAFGKNPQRRNEREPIPPPGSPEKPTHLDELGSDAWDHVVGLFKDMNMLSKADGGLIEMYAVTYSNYRKALDSVNKTGQVLEVEGKYGIELRRNPHSVELHKYMDRLTKLLAEMGLTPSSRSRVIAAPDEKEGAYEAIMKRRSDRN